MENGQQSTVIDYDFKHNNNSSTTTLTETKEVDSTINVSQRNTIIKDETIAYNSVLETLCAQLINNLNKNQKNDIERGNVQMEENKILEKYMDKVDQDRRDQEERLSKNMQLMEQRIVEERRLSEDRIEKKFNETMEALKATNGKIEKLECKLDEKTDKTIEKIDSTNKWIIATCLATILGIAGIAASAIWGGLIK